MNENTILKETSGVLQNIIIVFHIQFIQMYRKELFYMKDFNP